MTIGSSGWLKSGWWIPVPLLLALTALAVPYLWRVGFAGSALLLDHGFALVCHQRPERSFVIFGYPVAVCARCLGIYLGGTLGLLFRSSRQLAWRLLIAASALNVLDALSEFTGLHGNWMWTRLGIGLLLGSTTALLVASASREDRSVQGAHPSCFSIASGDAA